MKTVFFYVPFPSTKVAEGVVKKLVALRLIACANISAPGISIYRWKGKIHRSRECYAILKTSRQKAAKARAAVKKLHPYEVPCLAELALRNLNAEFANWILSET